MRLDASWRRRWFGLLLETWNRLGWRSAFSVLRCYMGLAVTGRRDEAWPIFVPGIRYAIWVRLNDFGTFREVFLQEQYSVDHFPEHAATMAGPDQEGGRRLIIDCGANVGFAALWLARRFPGALIYAVEPSPSNFAMLERNTASCKNIVREMGAVSDRAGRLFVQREAQDTPGARVSAAGAVGDVEIPAVTVPEIVARSGLPHPFLVKVDIEGAEDQLFRSNTAWMRDTDIMVLELHDWLFPFQGKSRSFWSSVTTQEFDILSRGPIVFCFNGANRW